MEFEWDEDKRLANLEKHGIDFAIVSALWNAPFRTNRMKRSSP
jgi:uncharacterized DUF497 family protein